MILAKVAGSVVASTRNDKMPNARYLLVKPCDVKGVEGKDGMVALDLMGAAPGEIVLVSQGSSTRQTETTKDKPVDAVLVGIVDMVDEKGKVVFRK